MQVHRHRLLAGRSPARHGPALPLLAAALALTSGGCQEVVLGRGPGHGTVVLVTDFSRVESERNDQDLKARIERLGATVKVVDQYEDQFPTDGLPQAVLVSSLAYSVAIRLPLPETTAPVIVMESYYWPFMGMTGDVEETHYKVYHEVAVRMADPAHPLAAGLSGDVTVLTATEEVNAGVPSTDAQVVATLARTWMQGEPFATLFAYDAGAMMPGGPAPGPRAGLFLRAEAVDLATEAGWDLFDAAVRWALASGGP